MFCPQTIVFNRWKIYIVRHERSDYRVTPWSQRINPLRYQITIFPGEQRRVTFNKDGWLHLSFSNFIFRLRAPKP